MNSELRRQTWGTFLEHLISKTPPNNQGGVECQISYANGFQAAGTLLKTEVPGVYRHLVYLQKGDGRSGDRALADYFFVAEDVMGVMKASEVEPPRIVGVQRDLMAK